MAKALDHEAGPTRARHKVLAFAATLAVITFIDRVCISQAAPNIRSELGFSEKQMGMVFSAFTLAYALFEIPGGWAGDKFGPRGILLKVVVMWSVFTAATGAAWNFLSMLVCRFLFGVGEAGCFPNLTKIFTIWLPSRERVRAQGILWLSARWGGAFTPLLVVAVLHWVHWRAAFMLFGTIGLVWAAWFYFWFRDRPGEHPSVNAQELAMMDGAETNAGGHGNVPWGKLVASRSVWLLWLQYFCMGYGYYFFYTWMPTYLNQQGAAISQMAWFSRLDSLFGLMFAADTVQKMKLAVLAGLPLFGGGIGCLAGSWLARLLAERWNDVRKARRVVAFCGLVLAGVMLVLATWISDPVLGVLALALAGFGDDLAMAPGWGACMDVGGRFAGSLSGSMNMIGNFGGAVGPLAVGFILDHGKSSPTALPSVHSWMIAFLAAAAVYAIGAIAWLFIDPVTPLEQEALGQFCTQCGYDLRATPDRCPECGTVPTAAL